MARPIIKRTSETYERDIAVLRRTRAAILLDGSLDKRRARKAISAIDGCIASLIELTSTLTNYA